MIDAAVRPSKPIQMRLRKQRWIEVREPDTGWLLFKYDPQRRIVEVQRRRQKTVVDLGKLESAGN